MGMGGYTENGSLTLATL